MVPRKRGGRRVGSGSAVKLNRTLPLTRSINGTSLPLREEDLMKRLLGTVVVATTLVVAASLPAQAAQPRTVHWVCDVPARAL